MDLKKRKLEENGGLVSSSPPPSSAPIAPSPAPAPAAAAAPTPASAPPAPVAAPPSPASASFELSPDDARLMIDPLSKEQLVDILIEATLCHYDILEEVRKFADKDPVHRKIFVRGLGWDTNTDTLKGVFSQFGELEEGIVIMDKNTGKSRGYGFITFKHMDGALSALREPSKRIDGRMTVCQLASTGPAPAQQPQDIAARKVYVGNVPMEWPADRLLNLFAQYGEIEEGPLGFDKQTGRSRGFALFIFKTAEATKRALEEPVKILDGQQLFCKLAVEGLKQKAGIQGQLDVSELPMAQVGGPVSASPNMQYGAVPQGLMSTGIAYNQSSNPPMNPGLIPALNSSMHPNIAGANQSHPQSLSASLPSSIINPSHAQVLNPGVSQVQTSLGLSSYGSTQAAMRPYSPQMAAYGGQSGAYPGVGVAASMYNVTPGSVPSQTPVLQSQGQYTQGQGQYTQGQGQYGQAQGQYQAQGHYGQGQGQYGQAQGQYTQGQGQYAQNQGQYNLSSYQTQPQVAPSSAPRAQTGVVPSMPYYGM